MAIVASLVLLTPACASSVSGSSSPTGTSGVDGPIVVAYYNGNPGTYAAFSPDGTSSRSLGLDGARRAGFNRALTTAAYVLNDDMSLRPATLMVSAVDGSKARKIWQFADDGYYPPSWSPSGSELAVGLSARENQGGVSDSPPSSTGVWVVNMDGTSRRQLAEGDVGPVAWSPDGRTIAYITTRYGTPTAVMVASASGGRPSVVATLNPPTGGTMAISPYGQSLTWSPDSRYVLLASETGNSNTLLGSQVTAYPAAGGTPRVVLPATARAKYTSVAYSPDGTRIAVIVFNVPAPAGRTTATTSGLSAPQGIVGQYLEVADADGTSLHPIATLTQLAEIAGWFPSTPH